MWKKTLSAAVLTCSLGACAPMSPPVSSRPQLSHPDPSPPMPSVPMPRSSAMQCDPAQARWAVGLAATPDVVERVQADARGRIALLIRPGDPEFEHFIVDRVTVRVDGRNIILAVACE